MLSRRVDAAYHEQAERCCPDGMGAECAHGKSTRGGDTRTNAGDSEMHSKVLDTRSTVHGNQDDESDGDDTHAPDDKGCTDASSVGEHGDTETCEEAQEVGWNDQLRMGRQSRVSSLGNG